MDVASLDAGGFTVTDATGQSVPGHAVLAQNRMSATFIPNGGWYSSIFTARITGTATDRYGNVATPRTWTFRLDAVAPAIAQANPADGATGVASDARLSYVFSEPLDAATVAPGGIATATVTDDASGAGAPATLSFDGVATLGIAPHTYWPHDRHYTINFPASLSDLQGNALGTARQVRFSTAASRFAPAFPAAADIGRQQVASIGDIDGDGHTDLVFTQWSDAVFPPQIHLFLRRGLANGGLASVTEPVAAPVYPCNQFAMAIGDTNGDGRKDLVLGGSCGIRVLLQEAGGSFSQGPRYPLPGFDYAAAVKLVDLDGDGRLDMLTAGNSTAFRVWMQTAAGEFNQTALVEAGLGALGTLHVTDLDGDGRVDVVASSAGVQSERLAVIRGLPGGGFGPPTVFANGEGWPYGVAVGDADGDGRQDLAVAIGGTLSPRVLIFHQGADRSFALSATIPLSLEPRGVHLMDIDGTGAKSLVVGHVEAFAVLPALGGGLFGSADFYEARRPPGDDGWMATGPPDSRGQSLLFFNGQVFPPKIPAGLAPSAAVDRGAQAQRKSAAALVQVQGIYRGLTIRNMFAPPDDRATHR